MVLSSSGLETTSNSQSQADRIALCALDHYCTHLPKKAKPKPEEWTVFAAIVAYHRLDNRMWVVSSASGTKCTAQRNNDFIVHDSHAEVLARRGFLRVLWHEIISKNSASHETKGDVEGKLIPYSRGLLIESSEGVNEGIGNSELNSKLVEKQYRLDPNIEIHFYISDSPCGDASIYRIPIASSHGEMEKSNNNNEILYTGAKVIISKATNVDAADCGGKHQLLSIQNTKVSKGNKEIEVIGNSTIEPVVAREEIQALGKLRTKSGRSNLPAHMRSQSHSCSDKIVVWSILGLQGAMLTKYLSPPVVPLTSVVVSIDSRFLTENTIINNEMEYHQQQIALERAIPDRVKNVWSSLERERHQKLPSWKPKIPTVHIVRGVFESGKAAMLVASEAKMNSGNKRKRISCDGELICSNGKKETRDDSKKKAPPCGTAFNWNQNEGLEVLVGARGIKHGKKPKRPEDIEKLASRLSRAKLMQNFSSIGGENLARKIGEDDKSSSTIPTTCLFSPMTLPVLTKRTYRQIKQDSAKPEWGNLKSTILTQDTSPLAGWLRCIDAHDTG